MFTEIQAAMQRLADGYQSNDAAAIEEATDALTKMGQQAVALTALPELKRRAVLLLHGGTTRWDWDHSLSVAEIATVLSVPESVVRLVLAERAAKEQGIMNEDRARHDAAVAASRAAIRNIRDTTPCPKCGVPAGSACVYKTGKRSPTMHYERQGDVDKVYDDYHPPTPYDFDARSEAIRRAGGR